MLLATFFQLITASLRRRKASIVPTIHLSSYNPSGRCIWYNFNQILTEVFVGLAFPLRSGKGVTKHKFIQPRVLLSFKQFHHHLGGSACRQCSAYASFPNSYEVSKPTFMLMDYISQLKTISNAK